MKDTIKNTVSEVYGNSISTLNNNTDILDRLSRSMNKNSINNMTNRIVNNSNTITKSMNNTSRVSRVSPLPDPRPSYDYNQTNKGSGLWVLVLLFLIVVVCGLLWFFKDNITKMVNDMKKDKNGEDDEESESKDEETDDKDEESNDENEDEKQEEDKEVEDNEPETNEEDKNKKETPKASKMSEDKSHQGVNEKELSQNYSPSQIVGENGGYCFIGSDDNMRHCVKAYKGDICSSGDIYSRIDKCIVPSLRISP